MALFAAIQCLMAPLNRSLLPFGESCLVLSKAAHKILLSKHLAVFVCDRCKSPAPSRAQGEGKNRCISQSSMPKKLLPLPLEAHGRFFQNSTVSAPTPHLLLSGPTSLS